MSGPQTNRLATKARCLVVGVRFGSFVLALLIAMPLAAQFGWRRSPPRFPDADYVMRAEFSFCRVMYEMVREEWLGHGWDTDYPDSDRNLMVRLGELTELNVERNEFETPEHWVVRLTDPELFKFPFIFMSDVGTVGFNAAESDALRQYLLKGGFLWVDDFWGEEAWYHWTRELGKALPSAEYPIVDIPLDHSLWSTLYQLDEVPQVPSIQHWYRSGGSTSERGIDSAEPHVRGIFDPDGRLLVLMTHNTDIADGWEREGESLEFFELFSLPMSYPLGINVVIYSMAH